MYRIRVDLRKATIRWFEAGGYARSALEKKPPVELPNGTPPKLKMLVNMLLRKSPSARPSLGRVVEQLKGIEEEQKTPQAPSVVADAAARLEQKRAHEESVAAEQRTKEVVRDDLAESGKTILAGIVSDLRARILADAPNCEHDASPEVALGNARGFAVSELQGSENHPEGAFPRSNFDVVLAIPFRIVSKIPSIFGNPPSFTANQRVLRAIGGTKYRS